MARKRGRPQKYKWIESNDLEKDYSAEAQYIKWASINNSALARLGYYGCPQCRSKNFNLRHDKKYENIRFYCQDCVYETSFRIKYPPKHSLRVITVYNDKGILIGEKTADNYHEKTTREIADSAVLLAEQKPDLSAYTY
jgi:transposase-like protein